MKQMWQRLHIDPAMIAINKISGGDEDTGRVGSADPPVKEREALETGLVTLRRDFLEMGMLSLRGCRCGQRQLSIH